MCIYGGVKTNGSQEYNNHHVTHTKYGIHLLGDHLIYLIRQMGAYLHYEYELGTYIHGSTQC